MDPYGIDKNDLIRFLSAFSWVYRFYFKVDVYGLANVPRRGRGVLVGNHSGGVALDGAMAMGSLLLDAEPPRLAHAMIDKFIHQFPGASKFMARTGQFTGNPDQAKRLLLDERLILVFPRGRPRHCKARGRTPTHSSTSERASCVWPSKRRVRSFLLVSSGVARRCRLSQTSGVWGGCSACPTIPVTKWGVLVPKPTRFQLLYGKPMYFEGSGHERDEIVNEMVDQVKDRIRDLIRQGRALRKKAISEEDLEL